MVAFFARQPMRKTKSQTQQSKLTKKTFLHENNNGCRKKAHEAIAKAVCCKKKHWNMKEEWHTELHGSGKGRAIHTK